MPSCVIPTCKNKSGNEKGISMHMFPYDEALKKIWVRIVRRTRLEDNWNPKRRSMICSAHFDEKDIQEINGIKRIQKGAIPTKNLATEVLQSHINKDDNLISDEDTEATSIEFVSAQRLRVPSPDTGEFDADPANIDTVHSFEERNLIYRIHRKIKYLHAYRQKIKILKKRNSQLAKHNNYLKETLMKCENGLDKG